MVRAKFKCNKKEKVQEGFSIQMNAVTDGSVENDQFFKYTPGGELHLSTINEAAAQQFEEGKEYYLDFTPAQ